MISFTPFCKEDYKEVAERICPLPLLDDVLSVMEGALSSDEEIEYAAAIFADCLCLRACDYGRYSFIYPFMLADGADAKSAVLAMVEYATREEIPLTIADVPSEELAETVIGFRNLDIDAEDIECASYRIKVKTPPMLLSEPPTYSEGELTLGPLTEADTAEYARLSRATETTRYWGYDYRSDNPDADDEYFYSASMLEFERGVSITLAVRWCSRLVGEAVMYAFDGRGTAEIAVRIFPELWGRGIGSRTVSSLIKIAEGMGLSRLYARVHNENLHSCNMFSHFAKRQTVSAEHRIFEIEITTGAEE